MMVLPGHISGGYLITRALLSFSNVHFEHGQIIILYAVGIFSSAAPDMDLFWYSFKHLILKRNDNDNHRDYVSHAPFVWLIPSIAIIILGYFTNSKFTEFIGLIFLCGSWTHFILDSIDFGIMWLWPFSKKRFAFNKKIEIDIPIEKGTIKSHWYFISKIYPHDISFYFEIALTVIAVISLLNLSF